METSVSTDDYRRAGNSAPTRSEGRALLRPDVVFFGDGIPSETTQLAGKAARAADAMLVVGTIGEVYPAGMLPTMAKRYGATIIEINTDQCEHTATITDISLRTPGTEAMDTLNRLVRRRFPRRRTSSLAGTRRSVTSWSWTVRR